MVGEWPHPLPEYEDEMGTPDGFTEDGCMIEMKTASDLYVGDYEPPAYGTPGSMIVWVGEKLTWEDCRSGYNHEYVVLDYDGDSSLFWMSEGIGFDYFLDSECEFPDEGGVFVIENVVGHIYPGNGWDVDADEEWEYGRIRPATLMEIEVNRGELDFLTETEISNLV